MNMHSQVSERGHPYFVHQDGPAPSLASEALEKADGDMRAAASILADKLLAQPKLVKEKLREWAEAWAFDQIALEVSNRRTQIIKAVTAPAVDGSRFRQAVEANHQRMMQMPIFGGKPIGEASPEEVRESANRYGLLASDAAMKARWQRAVAAAAGDVPRIADGLTEERLVALWEEARGN